MIIVVQSYLFPLTGYNTLLVVDRRGESRIFMGRGGGKILFAVTHIANANPESLTAGVQGPRKGHGSSEVLMLSNAI